MKQFFQLPSDQIAPEIFRGLTDSVNLDSTIPTVWSPVLEKKFEDLLELQQFAVVNTELENAPGDEVIINRMTDIGMAQDMDGSSTIGTIVGDLGLILSPETPWNQATVVETAVATEEVQRLFPTMKFKAVKMSLKALNRSFATVMDGVTDKLSYSMSSRMEFDCTNAISGIPTAPAGNRFGGSGVATPQQITGAAPMLQSMSLDAMEYLKTATKNNAWAFFPGKTIVCFLNPHQSADIMRDTDWMTLVQNQPGLLPYIFKGELFNFLGVRYVESTMVKFYAGGTKTNVTVAEPMWRTPTQANFTNPTVDRATRRWYFVKADHATPAVNIMPLYQFVEFPNGAGTTLSFTLKAVDLAKYPKVVAINYKDGWVEFDKEIGSTATNAPTAIFSYGTTSVYDSMWIGARAFAVAWKMRPRLAKEISCYGTQIGFGSVADWDVKKLNDETIWKCLTS